MSIFRILIVDDHPIVRQGYAHLIGKEADLEVCGYADSQDEAMQQIEAAGPDLAIVDISLKGSHGIELIENIQKQHRDVKVLVVSAHDETLFAERAMEAGATGYVNKQEATEKLVDGIRSVLQGRIFFSDEMTRHLLRNRVGNQRGGDRSSIETLTNRELEVFEMVGHGKTTRQIADTLQLSPKTIERYKEKLKNKLHIANATELVQQATRWVLERG